jgi:hypothetical protein
MRSCSFLVLLAACSSSAPGSTADATAGLACATTIAGYCNATACDRSLATAEQDKTLCPASLATCGAYEVITKAGVDTATVYYYQADQLVAIDHVLFPSHHACSAGPAAFDVPGCGSSSQTLPACQ